MRRTPLLGVMGWLAIPGVADAAPTTIAPVAEPVGISAWKGIQIWNDRDPATERWHLVVRRDGQIALLPGVTSSRGIAADVGPGPDGTARIVYVDRANGDRLTVVHPDGSGRRVVPNSAGASHPTISGPRVAWVAANNSVMTSRIGGQRRTRLSGAPKQTCYSPRQCLDVDAFVTDLELDGSTLALVDTFEEPEDAPDASGVSFDEVRLEDVHSRRSRLVASVTAGQAGQTLHGLSWAGGRLFLYESLTVSGTAVGAFRYDPRKRTYAVARSSTSLAGFAIDEDGAHAFEVPGAFNPDEEPSPSVVRRTDRLTFKPRRPLG